MKVRPAPWLLALVAVVLNLGGGPMAWAQLRDTSALADPAAAATPDCHGHETASDRAADPAPNSPPCCEDGGCSCVASALALSVPLIPARVASPGFIAPADTSALPAHPLDDNLRPPIR